MRRNRSNLMRLHVPDGHCPKPNESSKRTGNALNIPITRRPTQNSYLVLWHVWYSHQVWLTNYVSYYTDLNRTMTAAGNVWKLLFRWISVESSSAILPNAFNHTHRNNPTPEYARENTRIDIQLSTVEVKKHQNTIRVVPAIGPACPLFRLTRKFGFIIVFLLLTSDLDGIVDEQ